MNRYECLMFALQLFFIQYILSMCQIECTLTLLDIHTIVIIAQLERFMPGVCNGSKIGGMCMSEPNAGKLYALLLTDHYLLTTTYSYLLTTTYSY